MLINLGLASDKYASNNKLEISKTVAIVTIFHSIRSLATIACAMSLESKFVFFFVKLFYGNSLHPFISAVITFLQG